MVDGSNSTAWQPATPHDASVIIDIGKLQAVSRVLLVWGGVPPCQFSLSGSKESNNDFEELSPTQKVEISAPYDAQYARVVRIRKGNATAVEFRNSVQLRFLNLTIAGSFASDGLGATVAEVQIIKEDQGPVYGMNTGDIVSFVADGLWRIFSAAISWSS